MDDLIACLLACLLTDRNLRTAYHTFRNLCEKLYQYCHRNPKFHHITPILKSLHWLTLNQTIQYKVLCLNHKPLKTGHPSYLSSLLSLTPHRSTRSSSLITLNRPSVTSGLKMSNRSFFHSAPVLWNSLPSHLRHSAHYSTSSSPTSGSFISYLLNAYFQQQKLKSHLFRISFPP